MARGSAAWILAIAVPLAFFMGALLFTVTDPLMQNVFASSLWTAQTSWGADLLVWQRDIWKFLPVAVLLSLLTTVWVKTRRPA